MSRSSARRSTRYAAALLALLPVAAAQADIEIVIPDVIEPVQNNIRAFLSLTRYAERDDVTQETMSRLQRRIVSETRAALEPLGYYEPEVTYETVHEGDEVARHDSRQARTTGATVGSERHRDRSRRARARDP